MALDDWVLSGDFDLSEGVLQDLVWYYHSYQYVNKAADTNNRNHPGNQGGHSYHIWYSKWEFELRVCCYTYCSQRSKMDFHPWITLLIWIRNVHLFHPRFSHSYDFNIHHYIKRLELYIFGNTSVCSLVQPMLWPQWAEREGDGRAGFAVRLKVYVPL